VSDVSDDHLAEPPDDLLVEVEQLIGRLQHAHGADVADEATRLLAGIDAIHRAGLTHLMEVIRSMGGDAFVNRLIADPAIRLLLMSYDLIAADRRLAAEEALDAVRGHLHTHGVDVEILEVVGGVVYVRLHGMTGGHLSEPAVLHDLEEALRTGFIGFQELVTRAPRSAAAGTIPLGSLRKPVYRDVLGTDDLVDGGMKAIDLNGLPVLVARIGSDYVAVSNRCGLTPLPLEFSDLEGAELRCSWHGCRYDLRTGNRLDSAGDRLAVYPVRVEGDLVQIAIAAETIARGAH
jgi:nitrite reductase/ring-hydroxylating ferredoxin subunit/Fe-S cluster biogenesis protein NfuA